MFNLFKKTNPPSGSQTVVLKIDGMHCVACSLNIDSELEDLPGVITSTTNYASSTTVVTVTQDVNVLPQVKKSIEKFGYQVTSQM